MTRTKFWDKRNVEMSNSKELVVRQKFKTIDTVTGLDGTKYVVGSFTVRNGRTDDIFHYVMLAGTGLDEASDIPSINVYSEDFTLLFTFSYGSEGVSGFIPPKVSFAVVEDELLICCPGLPPVWGIVGAGLRIATLDTPTNQNTASLDIFPRGHCISWAGRAIICDGIGLYFSDALNPRAYTGANFINPPGEYVYDMHVNAGGSLILVTSAGVYSLPEDASYSGIGGIVLPVWSKLTDYGSVGYEKSTSYKGRVWGLTQRGVGLIDAKEPSEVSLSEKVGSRFNYGRIDFPDYRIGRLFAYSDGLIIAMGKFACFFDIINSLVSWYHITPGNYNNMVDIRGILKDHDGTDIFVQRGVATFKNGDNGEPISGGNDLLAVIGGRVNQPAKASPVVREVTFKTNSTFKPYYIAVNNKQKTSSTGKTATQSPTIGTASWSSTADADKISSEAMKSYEENFSIRGDEIFIEIGIGGHPAIIPDEVDVVFKGPGKERPTR